MDIAKLSTAKRIFDFIEGSQWESSCWPRSGSSNSCSHSNLSPGHAPLSALPQLAGVHEMVGDCMELLVSQRLVLVVGKDPCRPRRQTPPYLAQRPILKQRHCSFCMTHEPWVLTPESVAQIRSASFHRSSTNV